MNVHVEQLPASPAAGDLAALHALLRDAVEGGASIGYVLPLPEAEVATFWRGVLSSVGTGSRVLLVAREAGGLIVGTVQIEFAQKPNGRHRAEVQKLLVLRSRRGHGIGTALMNAIEAVARDARRSLLFLDTSVNGGAVGLYERCGYTRAGGIPRYAADPDGSLHDNVIFYKELTAAVSAPVFHLAQVNIAQMRAPLDTPPMAGFVARLAEINTLADGRPGFVWRFQSEAGDATYLRPYDDDRILFNLSVWETPAALKDFAYRGAHAEVFRQRAQWFEQMAEAWTALWWIPAGHTPTVDEAKQRLDHLRTHGATAHAFTFRELFPPPSAAAPAPHPA